MNIKSQICILAILSMFLVALIIFPAQNVQASPTILKIVPAKPIGSIPAGSSVVFNISIQDVINLMTWQVNVSWDPTQLGFANVIFPGDPGADDFVFANDPIYTMGPLTGPKSAVFSVVCNTAGGGKAFNGTGTLAQLNLTAVVSNPVSEIKFEAIPMDTFLLDKTGADITFETQTYVIPEMSSLLLLVALLAASSFMAAIKKKAKIKR